METINLIWGLETDTYSSFDANTSPFQGLLDTQIRNKGGFGWQRNRQGPRPYSDYSLLH